MKLSLDEQDDIKSIMMSDSWKSLSKLMGQVLERQQQVVIKYNLKDGAQGLVEEKARSEGAANFYKSLIKYRERAVKESK